MFWGGSGSSVLGPQQVEHNKVPPANRLHYCAFDKAYLKRPKGLDLGIGVYDSILGKGYTGMTLPNLWASTLGSGVLLGCC